MCICVLCGIKNKLKNKALKKKKKERNQSMCQKEEDGKMMCN